MLNNQLQSRSLITSELGLLILWIFIGMFCAQGPLSVEQGWLLGPPFREFRDHQEVLGETNKLLQAHRGRTNTLLVREYGKAFCGSLSMGRMRSARSRRQQSRKGSSLNKSTKWRPRIAKHRKVTAVSGWRRGTRRKRSGWSWIELGSLVELQVV